MVSHGTVEQQMNEREPYKYPKFGCERGACVLLEPDEGILFDNRYSHLTTKSPILSHLQVCRAEMAEV